MEREIFIEKVMRGEEVNLDDVAKSHAQNELIEIKSEAARRLDKEKSRREAAERRDTQIAELLRLDAEIEWISRENDDNDRRRVEAMRPFADRELELQKDWSQARSKFHQIFHQINGSTYDFRVVDNPLIAELKSRGAELKNINVDLFHAPLSPSANMVLKERERGKS